MVILTSFSSAKPRVKGFSLIYSFTTNENLICVQLAKIEHKGLFLNVDSDFDSRDLRKFLEKKEIITNIKQNPRNGQDKDIYFDEKL